MISGSYQDFSYFSPTEAIIFYNVVSNCGLHKLARVPVFDANFFIKDEEFNNCVIPTFALSTNQNRSPFSARLCSLSDSPKTVRYLDYSSVNFVWTSLLTHLNKSEGSKKITLRLLPPSSPDIQDFLLSVLISGVFSILRNTKSLEHRFTVCFEILNDDNGRLMSDKIFYFVAASFNSTLTIEEKEEFIPYGHSKKCFRDSYSWIESVREKCVGWFEDACDAEETGEHGKVLCVFLPNIEEIRGSVKRAILDSYSSVPLYLISDEDLLQSRPKKETFILLCSVGAFNDTRLLNVIKSLNINQIVHCGFTEMSNNLFTDIHLAASVLGVENNPDSVTVLMGPESFHYRCENNNVSQSHLALLLLSRRFLPQTLETAPSFVFHKDFFISEGGWALLLRTCSFLQKVGALQSFTVPGNTCIISFSSFGHFASSEMKVSVASFEEPLFSITEKKFLLWSFILRLKKKEVFDFFADSHPRVESIGALLDTFCKSNSLFFEEGNGQGELIELAKRLSTFGLDEDTGDKEEDDDQESHRIFTLLGSPFGKRVPLQTRLGEHSSTSCRGWYNRIHSGILSEERNGVLSYQPPLHSLYGELQTSDGRCIVQCPLEISYPVIVVRCALHIVFHNNNVILETHSEKRLLQMPKNIIDSAVFQRVVKNVKWSNVGLWLDGAMCESKLRRSTANFLAPLQLSGSVHLNKCQRNSSSKRRREKEEESDTVLREVQFTGRRPQTKTESETIDDFLVMVKEIGREKAEKALRGKKGFEFLRDDHFLHSFYEFKLLQNSSV